MSKHRPRPKKSGTVLAGSIVHCLLSTPSTEHDRMWYVAQDTTSRAVFDWVQQMRKEVEAATSRQALVKSFYVHNG